MMNIIDDLQPGPWPKMLQKFDIEGIMHKEPVLRQMNGKF
jgi:hypothetical protein